MKFTSKISFLFTILVVAFSVTACSKAQDVSGDCASSFTTPGSYENACGMEVSAQAEIAEIRMKADLQAGSMDWKLTINTHEAQGTYDVDWVGK